MIYIILWLYITGVIAGISVNNILSNVKLDLWEYSVIFVWPVAVPIFFLLFTGRRVYERITR